MKNENSAINIYVSRLVSSLQSETLQTKISDYNDHITKWEDDNGIPTMKPDPFFCRGTGDIDETCYSSHGPHQDSLLNRHGVVRLLSVITKQCHLLKDSVNWENVQKNTKKSKETASSQTLSNT